MAAPDSLSEQDLAAAREEVAAGRPFPVWFTPAAVGVPAGRSGKVLALGDPGDGDFIQVKPTGSRDTIFCSPNELTKTRPKRVRAVEQPPASPAPAQPAPPSELTSTGPKPGRAERSPEPPQPTQAAPRPERSPERARTSTARPAGRVAEVTVTLTGTSDGEWTVEVASGKKRTVRPMPVQPADVARAARSLPTDVGTAIESALEAARQRQLERVERLRAELDAAQRALQELSD
jgi:hypothetical protein